jgi:hypothetical protein
LGSALLLFVTRNNNITSQTDFSVTMSSSSNINIWPFCCAACGKGGDIDTWYPCGECDLVKYCNDTCKNDHRTKHKQFCEKCIAHDKILFKQPPLPKDCPICMLPFPCIYEFDAGTTFYACCGKELCHGCFNAMDEIDGDHPCPFCRSPNVSTSDEEEVRRLEALKEKGNEVAIYQLGEYYENGSHGLPQNWAKANELYLVAGELGYTDAYFNLACNYGDGFGMEIDEKKEKYYYEIAAIHGNVMARHYLGRMEGQSGNYQRMFKHLIISATGGYKFSLNGVKDGYTNGYVTKDQYENTIRECQKSQDEMKSEARDIVASLFEYE